MEPGMLPASPEPIRNNPVAHAVCHLKDHGYITPEETNVLLNLTYSGKWDTDVNDGRP
jgi:hypothetical protein